MAVKLKETYSDKHKTFKTEDVLSIIIKSPEIDNCSDSFEDIVIEKK